MTNYIEEMMWIAGIEQPNEQPITCKDRQEVYGLNCLGCMKYDEEKEECTVKGDYPDFSAAKQLEIIKLIDGITIRSDCFIMQDYHLMVYFNGKDFTQALAQLTTELMKANELDKQKVKEILNNER